MTSVKKRISAAFFIMVLVFITLVFSQDTLDAIKSIFEAGYLPLLLWAYVIGSVLMYTLIIVKKKSDVYGFFEKYASTLFSIATFGIGGSTSIALLKGIFLQHFYSIEYFIGFSNFDTVSMLILSSFLLIYSLLNCTKQLNEAVFYSSTNEVAGVAEEQNKPMQQNINATAD
ncbi:MAG: hypothetical protein QM504_05020 [Pseudomonadota bacterium]